MVEGHLLRNWGGACEIRGWVGSWCFDGVAMFASMLLSVLTRHCFMHCLLLWCAWFGSPWPVGILNICLVHIRNWKCGFLFINDIP